jgi:hypothetical protein
MSAGMDQETGEFEWIDFGAFLDDYFARRAGRQQAPQLELAWFDPADIWPAVRRRSALTDSPILRPSAAWRLGEGKAKRCAGPCNTPQHTSDLRSSS